MGTVRPHPWEPRPHPWEPPALWEPPAPLELLDPVVHTYLWELPTPVGTTSTPTPVGTIRHHPWEPPAPVGIACSAGVNCPPPGNCRARGNSPLPWDLARSRGNNSPTPLVFQPPAAMGTVRLLPWEPPFLMGTAPAVGTCTLALPLHAGAAAVHCPEGLHLRAPSPTSVNPALHPK